MAQHEAALGQPGFQFRTENAGLDGGRLGRLVDFEQVVQEGQIERHDKPVSARFRLESSHHAGPAAERDDGQSHFAATGEDGADFGFVSRINDNVSRFVHLKPAQANQIFVAFTERVEHALAGVIATIVPPDDGGQLFPQRFIEAAWWNVDRFESQRGRSFESLDAQTIAKVIQSGRRLRQGDTDVFRAPTPPFHFEASIGSFHMASAGLDCSRGHAAGDC